MTDEQVAELLTRHAPLDAFVLIEGKNGQVSVCATAPDHGLAALLIEREEEQRAAVAFLRKRAARRYDSIAAYRAATGWDGAARVAPTDQ